jgi:hypothetical protein
MDVCSFSFFEVGPSLGKQKAKDLFISRCADKKRNERVRMKI